MSVASAVVEGTWIASQKGLAELLHFVEPRVVWQDDHAAGCFAES